MQSRVFNYITILAKFLIILLITITFIITKSIYFILFTTILTIYLILLDINNVKRYVNFLKKYILILLIALIITILIVGKITFISMYKYVVVVLLINTFVSKLNFDKLNTLLYRLLVLIPNRKILSYKMTLKSYYINNIFGAKDELRKFENNGKVSYGLKSRLNYAKYKTERLDSNLKTSFYTIKKERPTVLSVILVLVFIYALYVGITRK